MLKRVGSKAKLWEEFRAYLAGHYEHEPVLSVGKKEYDWTIRYRKGGKTLVTLMPEENGFCVLVVLGKDEVAKTKDLKLNAFVKKVFQNAKQFHDGRWLWLRPQNMQDMTAIKELLTVKRKPGL
jgi:hypothetical protein